MGGAFALLSSHCGDFCMDHLPTVGHLPPYEKKKKPNARSMSKGGGWAGLEFTEP